MKKSHELDQAFVFFNEINIIAQLSSNMFERTLPHDLTNSQFSVLNWFVRVDTEATPGRLATAFSVTRGAMTNTLSKLEAKGFITVEPDSSSGRQKIVTMTPAGRSARDEAIASSAGMLSEFSAHFDGETISKLMPALQEIREHLDALRYS